MMVLVLAACDLSNSPAADDGPRLVQDVTIEPTTPAPTRILSATPEPTLPTLEVLSPLEVVTVEADFVLVTPTLPPSKTPSETPTITQTLTTSPTPTTTVTATATLPLFPTSIIVPITAPVPNPIQQVCDSTWFFIEPRPAGCPLSPPTASQGVYQAFQNGYMIWVSSQDAIYAFYSDRNQPRWQVFRDQFEEGMVEDDPAYDQSPFPNTWQPRRGFGMLWRNNSAVRDRIGWGIDEWEQPFSVLAQTAPDGSFFISDPFDGVFALLPNGADWARYSGYSGF